MFVRRRPLLRAAAVGGGAYMAGKRHAERSAHAAQGQPGQQAQTGGYATTQDTGAPTGPAAESSMSDQLAMLSSLHQQGSLTDEEFAAAKSRLLGG